METEVKSLEKTQRELRDRLEAASLTQERVRALEQFAVEIQKRLDYADNDFSKRLWLVETLNVTAVLRVVDGEKVLDAQCIIGEQALTLCGTTTRPIAFREFLARAACPRPFSIAPIKA